ncbi:MAG TPA: PH domain-containing protein [Actinomycetospora sp.]|nr:PH domain-containing protein [Actinomycetospora sp.]
MVTTEPTRDGVGLRPPTHPLPPRVRTWWRIHGLGWPGVTVVVLLVLAALITPASGWLTLAAGAVAVAGLVVGIALPAYWYRVHRWEVTDEAVYTRSGFLWQEWRAAPLSRVQTVDTTRGPLQQRLGLATLVVTTASAKGAVTVAGLAGDEADAIAHRLTRETQAVPGDAT